MGKETGSHERINIYTNLTNLVPDAVLNELQDKVSYIRQSIDRMVINIRNRGTNYDKVKHFFDEQFDPHKFSRDKNKTHVIHNYTYGDIPVRLVKYVSDDSFWFSISISNPNDEIQTLLKNFITEAGILRSHISISQIEFTLDFYPTAPEHLSSISSIFDNTLILKFSRKGSASSYRTTMYQGRGGNVRKGNKGLRCYPKNEDGKIFYRIELQANRYVKKNFGIDIESLPICFEDANIHQHIDFRKALDDKTIDNIARNFARKRIRKIPNFRGKFAKRVMQNAFKNAYIDKIKMRLSYDGYTVPVAEQISIFRTLKAHYKITNQVDQFFPRIRNTQKKIPEGNTEII